MQISVWRILLAAGALALLSGSATAASLPEIRTHARNTVPSCVTPAGLMRFLKDGNPNLDSKLHRIAHDYHKYGDALGVRWDYAFFQMILETNYLKFRTGSGKMGDAKPRQNNFAGLGTTGGGVPGESFSDVGTGVRAQIEHLVAYSGDRVEKPVAKRTAENQDDIIKRMKRLRRPVRFSDLQMRWAIDRGYARKIALIGERFHKGGYCDGSREMHAAKDDPPIRTVRTIRLPIPAMVHVGRLARADGR